MTICGCLCVLLYIAERLQPLMKSCSLVSSIFSSPLSAKRRGIGEHRLDMSHNNNQQRPILLLETFVGVLRLALLVAVVSTCSLGGFPRSCGCSLFGASSSHALRCGIDTVVTVVVGVVVAVSHLLSMFMAMRCDSRCGHRIVASVEQQREN